MLKYFVKAQKKQPIFHEHIWCTSLLENVAQNPRYNQTRRQDGYWVWPVIASEAPEFLRGLVGFCGLLEGCLLFERRFKRCVCVKIRSTTSNLRGFNRYTLGCFVEWTWRIYKLNSYNIWLKKCWRILLTNDGFQACNGTVIQRFSEYMLNHFDFENHEKNMGKASWAKPHRSHIFRPVPVQQCGTYSLAPSCRRCNPNRL